MRVLVTCDLHYNIARSREPVQAFAQTVCRLGGDALVLVGDTVGTDLAPLNEVFDLLQPFSGKILFVAGNHELWTAGGDSLHKYEHELAEVCNRHGVHYLDAAPFVADGVAIVGNVGWYDFSFRPSLMGIPLRFYQHKVSPGAAERFSKYDRLLERQDDIPPASLEIGTRWMDGVHVKLPCSDVQFTHRLAEKLRRQLDGVHDNARQIVAAIHHLPFAEVVPHSIIPTWEFATAFLGSELIGEVLLDYPKISHVFCGHTHRPSRHRIRHLDCICVGSTYMEKQYETLDI